MSNENELDFRPPLFKTVYLRNIEKGKKQPISISCRINHVDGRDLIYVEKHNGANTVVGFQDPDTGYFVTKLSPNDPGAVPHNVFREKALEFTEDWFDDELARLKKMHDENKAKFNDLYKPLNVINNAVTEMLEDRTEFYRDLDSQLNVLYSGPKPSVNAFVAYKDEEIRTNKLVTEKVPYLDPRFQELTDDQKAVADRVFDEFFDEESKHKVAWYFGRMLSQQPGKTALSTERMLKMLVVTSARGGSGKSTLFKGLTTALLGDAYCDVKPSFDTVFSINNRFGLSQLIPVRCILYNEAEWNDGSVPTHDFTGLRLSEIKSVLTDGKLSREQKYQQQTSSAVFSAQIVLTNHAPEITGGDESSALNRRILAAVVKPSRMTVKGKHLGLPEENEFVNYIVENAQAFANYCVDYYKHNHDEWLLVDYDPTLTSEEITADNGKEMDAATSARNDNYQAIIRYAASQAGLDDEIANSVIKRIDEVAHGDVDDNIFVEGGQVWLNSTYDAFRQLKAQPLRKTLLSLTGGKERKTFNKKTIYAVRMKY